MRLQRSELEDWLSSPITKKIIKELALQLELEERSLIDGDLRESHSALNYQIGLIAGLKRFLNFNYEDLIDET
jgi:hypothetical protein